MEFRLLTLDPTSSPPPGHNTTSTSTTNKLTINNSTWTLTPPLPITNDTTTPLPRYACISYKWGLDRQPHTLFPDKTMSLHTIPSLITAMQSTRNDQNYTAFWTDVFCVPPEEGPARQATLENLGWIYANAAEVVVVLGSETFAVLKEMVESGVVVGEEKLDVLEGDEWVKSVWTYQEVVNAKAVRFVSEVSLSQQQVSDYSDMGSDGAGNVHTEIPPSISFTDFFNALGYSLEKYRQRQQFSNTMAVVKRFPNLNVLENVLVDWMTGSCMQYSALTVFRNVCVKHNDVAANYYYAILGALSDEPELLKWSSSTRQQRVEQAEGPMEVNEIGEVLAEKVLGICEGKGDFSYIYTVARRDTDMKRRWRPRTTVLSPDGQGPPDLLRPILVWHHWGEAQSGTYDESGELWLHHVTIMQCVESRVVSDAGKRAFALWLGQGDLSSSDDDAAQATLVYESFLTAGFEGHAEPLIVPDGFVFTLKPINARMISNIVISNEIRFSFGAPGLVQYRDGDEEKRYCPCIFIGATQRLLEPGESILL